MVTTTRAERVSAAFVKIADTLVDDYDVLDLLHALVEESIGILDASAAGLLLVDQYGELQVLASTSEESQLVEVLQREAGAGPCVECFLTGTVVTVNDIRELGDRWPEFKDAALSQGFRSVHAIPLRVRGRTIGALNLFGSISGALSAEDAAIGQALADVATISILQERAIREAEMINDQLQRALTSRILIEQAKGVVAQLSNVNMHESFTRIRNHARSNHLTLHDTAARIVDRSLTL
ncbi:GAF and ANTAR domain-containing protein [Arthrobacter sp. 260]|uniref:GAF and ANTAR domain-containing protein n=1 Tax=Arthrobacter sp. 260 TaxID=2735314 RepID=UPI0014916652|nr:GAF and ANTAR domain-containing protein [Arthrobacter sp. 260]NOJ60246.1 GAF and ANTAR domain-containing protein [Arthrobacter sp. 260]